MIEPRRMTQAEFMRNFNDGNREEFNSKLFERDNQEIIDMVSKVILTCERDKHFTLKVLSIKPILNYEEIYDTLREYEQGKKRNTIDNNYDYIQMRDSDIMLLEVKYFIRKNGIERMKLEGENKEVAVENPEQVITVLIALPRFVNKYYFRLSGNYYSPIVQIVDGSTYNNATASNSKCDSVTLKTLFMSVRLFRMFRDMVDENSKEKIRAILYTSIIFNSHVNSMYYIFAKYGYYVTMELFGVNCISVSDKPEISEDYLCFKKHNIYISVPKFMFQEPVIQSLVSTIYDSVNKDTTYDQIFDVRYWLMTLGGAFRNYSIDKGLSALDSLESIYDIPTKDSIRLPDHMKQNIYQVIKWMICDFTSLRQKDNVDVSMKKMRISEYIAHAYATKISKGVHRISDLGKKVRMKNIISAISTNPMYIISTIIGMSNLISYVDMVNDNDATSALKCTYKGISGLGEEGSVQDVYRFVDPSSIGILDPDTSSASDPGMSGMICPMTDIYGNAFTDYQEPNTWDDTINKLNGEFMQVYNIVVPLQFNNPIDFVQYDYIKDQIVKENINVGRLVCPIKDLNGIIDYASDVLPTEEEIRIAKAKKTSSLFTIVDEEDDTSFDEED